MSRTIDRIQETRRELERLEALAVIEREDPFTAMIIRNALNNPGAATTHGIRLQAMHDTCIALHVEGLWTVSAERAMEFLITYHAGQIHERSLRSTLYLPKREDEGQSNERA